MPKSQKLFNDALKQSLRGNLYFIAIAPNPLILNLFWSRHLKTTFILKLLPLTIFRLSEYFIKKEYFKDTFILCNGFFEKTLYTQYISELINDGFKTAYLSLTILGK